MYWLTDLLMLLSYLTLTFGISSVALFLCLAHSLDFENGEDAERLLAICIGTGPLVFSWFFRWLMTIAPTRSDGFYLLLMSALCILPCLFYRRRTNVLCRAVNGWRMRLWHHAPVSVRLLLTLVGLAMAVQVLLAVLSPLSANDPLKYATMTKLLYNERSLVSYPFQNTVFETGYYGPTTHPLGYHMLLVWAYIWNGLRSNPQWLHPVHIKVIAPFFSCASAFLLLGVRPRKVTIGLFAGLLLLTTPLFLGHSMILHIDPIRIYAFLLAFTALDVLIERHTWRRVIFTGACIGAALYTHTIGFLALPMAVVGYGILSKENYRKRIYTILLIIFVPIILAGDRYVANYELYGSPINFRIPVTEIPQLDYKNYVRIKRDIDSLHERYMNGLFSGFIDIQSFGYTYWLALAGIFMQIWRRQFSTEMLLFLSIIIQYYGMILLSLLLDMDTFIMNQRYYLTIQPFVVFWASICLTSTYELVTSPSKKTMFFKN